MPLISLFVVILFCAACSSSNTQTDAGSQDVQDNPDENDVGDTNSSTRVLKFGQQMVIDQGQAGLQLDLAATTIGRFGVAYYKHVEEQVSCVGSTGVCGTPPDGAQWECQTGLCVAVCTTPIQGDDYPRVEYDEVRYAEFDGNAWTPEPVASISSMVLSGIQLAFKDNQPLIAYLGGESGQQVCGGTDLIVARKSGQTWSTPAAVTDSSQAGTGTDGCPQMQNICDFGDVVGLWPALAVAPNGTVGIIYRDIHNGYTKDAQDSSDLEFTWSTSTTSWNHEPVDLARGSGIYSVLAYGADNVPAVVYYNDKHGQINFNLRDPQWRSTQEACVNNTCADGYACAEDRCSNVILELGQSIPEESLSLTIAPDGRYLVAYFDPDRKSLMLAHSADGLSWTKGIIDSDGTTGLYPTIAINPVTDMPAIAYYRCGEKQSSTQDCHRNYDGVRFAHFVGQWPDELVMQNSWKKNQDLVNKADRDAREGLHLRMAFAPDGSVGLAYSYLWVDPVEDKINRSLMFRLGTWEDE